MRMLDALLRLAGSLAVSEGTSRRRRGVSTAYYAVFHRLAKLCLDQVQGVDGQLSEEEQERVYRALDHGSLKTTMLHGDIARHPILASLGNDIVVLQSERNRADYLPPKRGMFPLPDSRDLVDRAQRVVEALDALGPSDRRLLAIHLLFKKRPQ